MNAADKKTLSDFAGEHPNCWLCQRRPTEIHHIAGRNHRTLAHHRTNLFAACQRCHADIIPSMDVSLQIWIKKWMDQEGYSEAEMRALRKAKNGRTDIPYLGDKL